MAGTRIFVSHIHEDEPHIEKMKALLAEQGFDVSDSSITSEKPNNANETEYIKSLIRGKIDWAEVVVVLISPGMRDSEFVDYEIEYASRKDKRIVGVWTHGAGDADLPDALEQHADAVVTWRGGRIKDAICGNTNDHEKRDGSKRGDLAITRHGC